MHTLPAQRGGRRGGCEESSQAAREAKQMVSQVPAQWEACPGAEPGCLQWVRQGSEEHMYWASPCLQTWEQSRIKLGWMKIGTEMTYRSYEGAVRTGPIKDVLKVVSEKVAFKQKTLFEILPARKGVPSTCSTERRDCVAYNCVSRVSKLLEQGGRQ